MGSPNQISWSQLKRLEIPRIKPDNDMDILKGIHKQCHEREPEVRERINYNHMAGQDKDILAYTH